MKSGPFLLALAILGASPDIHYFRYERLVENAPAPGAQTCVSLDPTVFADAAPGLADLRLYRGQYPAAVETPYVLRLAAPAATPDKSITPLNAGLRGSATVFDAMMPDGHYQDIDLTINHQDFIATITVYGSHSQAANPGTRLGSYTVFDLSKQRLGRSTVLHLPESDFRYLHFKVDGPLKPDEIPALSVESPPIVESSYTAVAQSSHIAADAHHSTLQFTIPAHVPIDRIVFTAPAEPVNFSRDVTVTFTPMPGKQETDEEEPPHPVTITGTLMRIHRVEDGHRIDEENLTVDTVPRDQEGPGNLKISIDNGDDTPWIPQSVQLQMLEHKLCFEAAANTTYRLFYGDEALTAPRYDYATLFVPENNSVPATLGPEEANSLYEKRPDTRPFTEKHPALLWAALLAVIVLLGGIAVQSLLGKPPASRPQ